MREVCIEQDCVSAESPAYFDLTPLFINQDEILLNN